MSDQTSQTNAIEKQENKIREICGPKKPRLARKQRWFFRNVFAAGQPVSEAMEALRIRPSTFNRWLNSPAFARELEMNLVRFHTEARLEIARGTSLAVTSLAHVNKTGMRNEEVRRAANDLLRLSRLYNRTASPAALVQVGVKLDQLSVLLEPLGVKVVSNELKKGPSGSRKITENPDKIPLCAPKNEAPNDFQSKITSVVEAEPKFLSDI